MKTKQGFFVIIILICMQNIFSQELHEAIKEGSLPNVQKLIENDSDLLIKKYKIEKSIDRFIPTEISPLFDAILYGRFEIIQYFIEKGVDLTKDNYAIYLAVLQKEEKVKQLLIKNGAKIVHDTTPHMRPNILTQAIWLYPEIELTEELISLGASINVDWGITGNYTHTPLGMATRRMLPQIVKLLLEKGAIINQKRNNGQVGLHDAIFYSSQSNPITGYSPETLYHLLAYGGDKNHRDNNGDIPFEYAAIEGVTLALKILWDDAYPVSKTNFDGMTLLHRTVIKGYLDPVKFLISKGFDVNAKDNEGKTPLYYAQKYGHKKIASFIKKVGGASDKTFDGESINNILNKELKKGQAYVWYLGRYGWAIKTKNNLIIKPWDWNEVDPDNPSLSNGTFVSKELVNQNIISFDKRTAEELVSKNAFLKSASTEKNISLISSRKSLSEQIQSVDLNSMETKKVGNAMVQKDNNNNYLIIADGIKIFISGYRLPDNDQFIKEIKKSDISFFGIGGARGNFPASAVYDAMTNIEIYQPKTMLFHSIYSNTSSYQQLNLQLKERGCKINLPLTKFPGDHFFYDASKMSDLNNTQTSSNQKKSGVTEIENAIKEGDFKDGQKKFKEILKNRDNYYFFSSELNSMGYRYLRQGKNDEAIQIFKWNVQLFPDDYNVYDSLGEAFIEIGNTKEAVKNYKKVYEMNPENSYIKKVYESLEN